METGSAGIHLAAIRRASLDPSRARTHTTPPLAHIRRGFAASTTTSASSDGSGPPSNPVSSLPPRKHFTDAMRAARAANDIPGVMKHFGELCEHYPDSQGPGAFEILLSIAAHEGNPEAAMETLEAMLAVGYPPTHHTHRKIIIAHNRGGQLTQAWEWLQMLAQSEGDEYLAHAEGNTGATLFNAVLTGASKKADVVVFHECWTAMKHARVDPDEGTLEAFMLMESKIGDSEGVEGVWERGEEFKYLHPVDNRSPRLFCRRVEAHARIATYLLKPRDVSRGGRGRWRLPTVGEASMEQQALDKGRHSVEVRRAAWLSRGAAAIALDELYARVTPETSGDGSGNVSTVARDDAAVTHPRDVRDATTTLCNAYAVCGDSDAIRDLMERMSEAGVKPDAFVFNALLRSEAADRSLAWHPDEDVEGADPGADMGADTAKVPSGGLNSSYTHAEELQNAVIRVEEMMRDMVESGVDPDLHSFMALLTAYAKVGDVAAAGDALAGMKARGITLDTWAFNALLQACATASDLDSAVRIRNAMRTSDIAPDDITFLHLFTACARRTRAVAVTLRDEEDWDEEWEWGAYDGEGGGGAWPGTDPTGAKRHHLGARAAESHAKLTGALTAAEKGGDASPPGVGVGRVMGVGEAARAAAAAAREGLSSVRDVFKDLRKDGEPIRLTPSGDEDRTGSETVAGIRNGASPELARARAALRDFRADMRSSDVEFTPQCATALVQTMGQLREFDEMMAFVRKPPPGVERDVYMYTQALHALAHDPFHWKRNSLGPDDDEEDEGAEGADTAVRREGAKVKTGPRAALELADEMVRLGMRPTRVTLNCVLLACAHLSDYAEALRRFDAHVASGGEIGVGTYNALLRCAWAAGVFEQNAFSIVEAMTNEGFKPNTHTELTLRRCGGFGRGMGGDRDVSDSLLKRFGFEVDTPFNPEPWEVDDETGEENSHRNGLRGPPQREPLVGTIGVDDDDDDIRGLAEGDMEEPLVYSRKDGKLTRAGRRWNKR